MYWTSTLSHGGEFDKLYTESGPPLHFAGAILKAPLLQVSYAFRSERMLMEHLNSNYRFAGSWEWKWASRCGTARMFSKNRERNKKVRHY